VDAARRLFVTDGFAATGTAAIVAAAGVGTRGALYHHFPDKEALFGAVFDEVQAKLGRAVVASVIADPDDPLATLGATMTAFLDALADDEDARMVFRDGPTAMGWAGFRAAEVRSAAKPFQDLLDRAAEQGHLVDIPTPTLARLLVAALDEAALAVITATDEAATRDQWSTTLDRVLGGLRKR
jgi:AcrR family transcriptional regulator